METSKIIISNMFSLLNNQDENIVEKIKTNLILLLENESKINHFKYSHIDKFNENEIDISFDDNITKTINIDYETIDNLKSDSKDTRYFACKKILHDFYNEVNYYRKYKLITNNVYYSKYILKLCKYFIINNNFNFKNNKYINDEVSRYIKHIKGDILIKYPILLLEYDINTYNKKNICELYNDMKVYIDKYSYNEELLDNYKDLYYEIINNSLNHINLEDKEELIKEYDCYELIDYFEELKKYNNKNKNNNYNVNSLIKFIEDNTDCDGSNIYRVLYGDDNNE